MTRQAEGWGVSLFKVVSSEKGIGAFSGRECLRATRKSFWFVSRDPAPFILTLHTHLDLEHHVLERAQHEKLHRRILVRRFVERVR